MEESDFKNAVPPPEVTAVVLKYHCDLEAYAKFRFELEMEREKSIVSRVDRLLTVCSLSIAVMTPFLAFLPNVWSGIERISFLVLSAEWAVAFFFCLFCLIQAQDWKEILWFEDTEKWAENLKQYAPSDEIRRHSLWFRAYRDVQKSVEQRNNARRKMLLHSTTLYLISVYFFLADVAIALITSLGNVQALSPVDLIVLAHIPAAFSLVAYRIIVIRSPSEKFS